MFVSVWSLFGLRLISLGIGLRSSNGFVDDDEEDGTETGGGGLFVSTGVICVIEPMGALTETLLPPRGSSVVSLSLALCEFRSRSVTRESLAVVAVANVVVSPLLALLAANASPLALLASVARSAGSVLLMGVKFCCVLDAERLRGAASGKGSDAVDILLAVVLIVLHLIDLAVLVVLVVTVELALLLAFGFW